MSDDPWPKNILMVLTNCADPDREEEFNNWYNEVHLPDLAEMHGIVSAARYRITREKPGAKYLAIYDLGSGDPRVKIREVMSGDRERKRRGRMFDAAKLFFGGTFERIDK